jgi:probable rRNA maturation factor
MSQKNKLSLSVQFADKTLAEQLPRAAIRRWVQAALFAPAELTIRFVGQAEGQTLNRDYRGKNYATNVLTFAYTEDEPDADTQADIVLCSDVLIREANDLSIPVQQHAAHLVVHGVMHAQGYDHEIDADAQEMEKLETTILQQLGWPDPYAAT